MKILNLLPRRMLSSSLFPSLGDAGSVSVPGSGVGNGFKKLLVPAETIEVLKKKMGIFTPSAIQRTLLPLVHAHSDIIVKDMTGSGKTIGLVLGVLSKRQPTSFNSKLLTIGEDDLEDFARRRLEGKVYTESLFIVPSRDLAIQIHNWILQLGASSEQEKANSLNLVQLAVGGEDLQQQKETMLKIIPRIIVGTPNRLMELYNAKAYKVSRLQTLIVDEVDHIVQPLSRYATVKLKYGRHLHPPVGEELMNCIIQERKHTDSKRYGSGYGSLKKDKAAKKNLQVIVSSATINSPLRKLLRMKEWQSDPILLDLNTTLPTTINHLAYMLDERQMLIPVLDKELDNVDPNEPLPMERDHVMDVDLVSESISSICYSNEIRETLLFNNEERGGGGSLLPLIERLQTLGLKADYLSSLKKEDFLPRGEQKSSAIRKGPVRTTKIFVARDFESRGLDIPNLSHVLLVGSYSPQSYIHTSGRTGRFGREGVAISLLLDVHQKRRYLKMMKHLGLRLGGAQHKM